MPLAERTPQNAAQSSPLLRFAALRRCPRRRYYAGNADRDSRLQDKKISFDAPRVYVGEFLEEVTRQTGVPITAEDRNTASGEVIALHLKNAPLGDVLDALWSLVSYQKAEWNWLREGEKGKYAYRLQRTDRAARYSKDLADAAQQEFEGHIAHMMDWADLKPEDLQNTRRKTPEPTMRWANGTRAIPTMHFLASTLSKAQLRNFYRVNVSPSTITL